MHSKTRAILKRALIYSLYAFFLFLALNIKILLVSTIFFSFFAVALIGDLWLVYHYRYSDDKEKRRVNSKKPLYRFYYDQLYRPADSTLIEYMAHKVKKRKKQP